MRGKKPNKPYVTDHDAQAWVHTPEIDDVLECLFSDASSGNESFNEFCDNLGLSNDSISAFDSYRQCMEAGSKLRKALGSEYQTTRERIEERNR